MQQTFQQIFQQTFQQTFQQPSAAAMPSSPAIAVRSIARRQSAAKPIMPQIFGALMLGIIMLYGVGFASIDLAHNAAHDGRHAVAFPCH